MANPASAIRNWVQTQWPEATVVRRTRTTIVHQHPADPRRHLAVLRLDPLHILGTETEIDTAWVSDTGAWQWRMTVADYEARAKAAFNGAPLIEYRQGGEWVTLQARQLEWTNARNDVQLAGSVQAVSATASDDTLRWADAYGVGRDFEWQTQSERLSKYVKLASYVSLPAPSSQVLGGANPVLRVGFQFAYEEAVLTVHLDGQPWTGGTRPTLDTTSPIEFRRGDGTVAFRFVAPRAWGSNGEPAPSVVQRVSKSGPNLLIEVRVPQAWLETAVYPVTIDPTFDVQPDATAGNDAFLQSGQPGNNAGGQPVLWTANALFGEDRRSLIEFDTSSIPAGATVVSAELRLTTRSDWSADDDNTLQVFHLLTANDGWAEGAGDNEAAQAGEVTWNHHTHDTQRWAGDDEEDGGADAGCSVAGVDHAADPDGTITWTTAPAADTEQVIDLTPAAVEAMLAQGYSAFVTKLTAAGKAITHHSSDSSTAGFRPRLIIEYTEGGAPQFARPDADVAAGDWTPSTGSDLHAMLSDEEPNDGTFIESAAEPANDTARIRLSSLGVPGVRTGHVLRVRVRRKPD